MQKIFRRIQTSILTFLSRKDWIYAVQLLVLFTIAYLPIGLRLGFLAIEPQLAWQTVIGVMIGALFMPALIEELGFRVLLIPHPTEPIS